MTFAAVHAWENLVNAWRNAARGKRSGPAVIAFEYRLEEHLVDLQESLAQGHWRPGPYVNFYIHEPKRRLISAAPFRDRVVHHALCQVIEPAFERSFITDSYANRVGKGTHRALNRVQTLARRFPYVLQMDLRQFFPAMDHAILRAVLAKKVRDPDILQLIDRILASGGHLHDEDYAMVWFPEDDLSAAWRDRGLPIGNLTSQFWANCYLNGFDHYVTRTLQLPGYVRYVDDFVVFGKSKAALWDCKQAIVERLATLRMSIHPGAHPKPVTEGIPFLGFVTYPQERRLKRRKGIHFQRHLNRMLASWHAGELATEDLEASMRGWINHVRFANTIGLRKKIIGRVRLNHSKRFEK